MAQPQRGDWELFEAWAREGAHWCNSKKKVDFVRANDEAGLRCFEGFKVALVLVSAESSKQPRRTSFQARSSVFQRYLKVCHFLAEL